MKWLFGICLTAAIALAAAESGMAAERQATPVSSIRAHDGFEVQLLRSAQEGEGSWVSMTFDDSGRIVVGLDDRGLARLTLDPKTHAVAYERLANTESLRHIRGVLYAHDSLYVCATDSHGVYRLRDLDGDGQFEQAELLQHLPYESRYGHGTNQIVLGPEDQLYLVCGNDVVFPAAMEQDSPYRGGRNDWLLPSPHDAGQDDRVGYIARLDPEGKSWTVLAGGLRNPFDLAFNRNGEMFTWDADMEWDLGLPWYRPTRLNHVVSGGEYGWRWGTGKWPAWFPDSLPTTLDTGLGSPTSMAFGHTSNWPQRYRDALFMADWQFGRILMVDLVPRGATYEASAQWFLEGGPLNVCDHVFGPDGALYFVTGGRGSQSGLYRVIWKGDGEVSPEPVREQPPAAVAQAEAARQIRQQLETYHRQRDPASLDFIWKYLADDDPWLRFSARVALENQPVAGWRERIDVAGDSLAAQAALLALARVGEPADQARILSELADLPWTQMDPRQWLLPLRTMQLTIIRHGEPDAQLRQRLIDRLDPLFPQHDFAVNWLLQELLVKLQAPEMIPRSLDLLEAAATQEEQIQYAKTLSKIAQPWDGASAKRIIQWLARTRNLSGGKLAATAWRNLRTDFEAQLTPDVLAQVQAELAQLDAPLTEGPAAELAARPLVRNWTIEDLIDDVVNLKPDEHSLALGHQALSAAACLRCHRMGDSGSPVGPDLTHVGKRFDGRALLESIIEPSRQVDPKYLNATYLLSDGRIVSGRTLGVSKQQLTIESDPLSGRTIVVDRQEIEASLPTTVSPMPAQLLDTLTREEVLALIALLRR
jgi:putative heme-binding domain-containing protein